MKILFKFASRSRPQKCLLGINNILTNLIDRENYLIFITADKDDGTMYNKQFMGQLAPLIKGGSKIEIHFGKSKNKIDAINRDMELIDERFKWDILVNFSDDMEFVVRGFDTVIRQMMTQNFPDTDGNLHFNDGFTGRTVSTMSIMGRVYYNRFGYIYHPAYKSLWCDVEYTDVASKLRKIQYFNEVIYKHNHPANIGGVIDPQYQDTESFWKEDSDTYEKRKSKNFDL